MAQHTVAQRNVMHNTFGTMRILILRRQQNLEAVLRESTPRILQDIAFHQSPRTVLEFQIVFHDVRDPNEIRITSIPRWRFVEVVPADFYVSWRRAPASTPKHHTFSRRLQIIVYDLV